MTKHALHLLCLAGLAFLPACPAALVGAGAAAGIWVYDSSSDATGEIVVAVSPSLLFEEAVRFARERGVDVRVYDAEMRVEFSVDRVDVVMVVFLVPGEEDVSRFKVTARSTLRGRADLARQYALDVQERALRRLGPVDQPAGR